MVRPAEIYRVGVSITYDLRCRIPDYGAWPDSFLAGAQWRVCNVCAGVPKVPLPAAPPPPAIIKHMPAGITSMGLENWYGSPTVYPTNAMAFTRAHVGAVRGQVVLIAWNQVEPSPGTYNDAPIDAALDTVRAFNAANPTSPVVVEFRAVAGGHAPAWVQALDGGPVVLSTGRYAHWWSASYRAAWRGEMAHLAARYQSDPLLHGIAISSCSSITDEPMVLPGGADVAALKQAGWTNAAQLACLQGADADYAAWTLVDVDYAFNPWTAGGRTDVSEGLATAHRAALGSRGVVGNHGFQVPLKPVAVPLYAQLQALGAPVEAQAYAPTTDVAAAVAAYPWVTQVQVFDRTRITTAALAAIGALVGR